MEGFQTRENTWCEHVLAFKAPSSLDLGWWWSNEHKLAPDCGVLMSSADTRGRNLVPFASRGPQARGYPEETSCTHSSSRQGSCQETQLAHPCGRQQPSPPPPRLAVWSDQASEDRGTCTPEQRTWGSRTFPHLAPWLVCFTSTLSACLNLEWVSFSNE